MARYGNRTITVLFFVLTLAVAPATARAQQQPSVPDTTISDRRERIGENHWRFLGHVELERGDTKLYADTIEFFSGEDRAVAAGNVVLTQGSNRIAADRAQFNTKTRFGTFYNATGIATAQPGRQTPGPRGLVVPQVPGQDTVVYFFGDTVEKIGPKKYKINNGGFTTCVQPTPRWDLHADTVVLNIDNYTLLRNAVLTVKGVPMFYLPVMYYPTKKEDRATGFLIPTYGMSTVRGQAIHNAFFWAVDRSEDLTFMHDWFSKAGQGAGTEYRYNFGGGSDGAFRAYMLNQNESTYLQPNGTQSVLPAERSFEVRGGANQMLPGRLRARARVDYFSSLQTMQTFNTNIYDASRNQRSFGGNVVGAWNAYTLNGTFDHNEYFSSGSGSVSTLTGGWPRVAFSRNERPIPGTPLYFAATTEYAHLLQSQKNKTAGRGVDKSLTRLDFAPQLRFPFKRWQWFTVNSTLGWRDTYYTRSQDGRGNVLDDAVNRRLFTLQAQLVGPVFNRIWDTPENGYAEKFKHSIEPFLNVLRTSSVDNFSRIVQLEGLDYMIGGVQYAYGLTNRFYAKQRAAAAGQPSQSREIMNVELRQTYYTNQRAALSDSRYASSFTGAAASNFSPIALSVRLMPTNEFNATIGAEFDSRYRELRTVTASGTYSWNSRIQTTASWSKKAFIEELSGFNDRRQLTHGLGATSTLRTSDNRVGGIYSFNYDVLNTAMLQQRFSAFYNAQCCGIAFEFQNFNLGGVRGAPVPADRRFFLSFTLAGLGNFSPFNGGLSGVPR